MKKTASILDFIYPGLDPAVWSEDGKLLPEHKDIIMSTIQKTLEEEGLQDSDKWMDQVKVIGGMTTYRYTFDSDIDIHIKVNLPAFIQTNKPEMSEQEAHDYLDALRKRMNEAQTPLANTTHPTEYYFETPFVNKEGSPGSGVYDVVNETWDIAPVSIDKDFDIEEVHKATVDIANTMADEIEIGLGRMDRHVRRIEELQNVITAWDTDQKKKFEDKLTVKLREIETEIKKHVQTLEQTVEERRQYNPEGEGEIKFKYLQKFGYMTIIKELAKFIEDDGKITEDEIPEIKKVLDEAGLGLSKIDKESDFSPSIAVSPPNNHWNPDSNVVIPVDPDAESDEETWENGELADKPRKSMWKRILDLIIGDREQTKEGGIVTNVENAVGLDAKVYKNPTKQVMESLLSKADKTDGLRYISLPDQSFYAWIDDNLTHEIVIKALWGDEDWESVYNDGAGVINDKRDLDAFDAVFYTANKKASPPPVSDYKERRIQPLGVTEFLEFYEVAPQEAQDEVDALLEEDKTKEAWVLMEKYLGRSHLKLSKDTVSPTTWDRTKPKQENEPFSPLPTTFKKDINEDNLNWRFPWKFMGKPKGPNYSNEREVIKFLEDMPMSKNDKKAIYIQNASWIAPDGKVYEVRSAKESGKQFTHSDWASENTEILEQYGITTSSEEMFYSPVDAMMENNWACIGDSWKDDAWDVVVKDLRSIPDTIQTVLESFLQSGTKVTVSQHKGGGSVEIEYPWKSLQQAVNRAMSVPAMAASMPMSKNDKKSSGAFRAWINPNGEIFRLDDSKREMHGEWIRENKDTLAKEYGLNFDKFTHYIWANAIYYLIENGWTRVHGRNRSLRSEWNITTDNVRNLSSGTQAIIPYIGEMDILVIEVPNGESAIIESYRVDDDLQHQINRALQQKRMVPANKKSSVYTNEEMEKIYVDQHEMTEGPGQGAGWTPHDFNNSTTDYPKPEDLEKPKVHLDRWHKTDTPIPSYEVTFYLGQSKSDEND